MDYEIKYIYSLLKIIFLVCISSSVNALELYQPSLPTRSVAMGSTSISDARGVESIFLNPAALSKVQGFSFNVFTVGAGVSTNALDLVTQFSSTGASFTVSDLNNLYGKRIFTEISAQSGFVLPNFGLGVYSSNSALQNFTNPAFSTYNVDLVSDYGYVVAGAIELNKNLSFGVSARHVKRWSGNKDIFLTSLIGSNPQNVIETQLPDKGSGNALDLGLMWEEQSNGNKKNFSFVWRDVGHTKFQASAGVGPEEQKDNLIFGASHQSSLSFMTWTNAFEYKFIRSEGSFGKKVHIGTELSLALIDLRAGFSQGYLSYGVAVDLALIRIEAAAFTTETGAEPGQTGNDRYQASVSLDLDFDQSFKLSNENGKKRRLNQRR